MSNESPLQTLIDRFEKRNDEWRVTERTVVYDWVRPLGEAPGGSEAQRFGVRMPIGAHRPEDPWYKLLTRMD
jgi:hypothetical protein